MNAAEAAAAAEEAALAKAKTDAEYAKQQAAIQKQQQKEAAAAQKEYERLMKATAGKNRTTRSTAKSPIDEILGSKATQTILGGVIRGMFGTGRR
ncbi:multidrug efflux pump subunit AcrA (membrane-fusion protein) [Microbacterium invictum]|uniref:Multidrug efflux pump subunit AcrA (Membrane-fusion protein) n=1 Tax=Microbacterium invictum TaxID=515415 RepID=A0AA40SLL0_9MICO|nr:multidrug efflux pump subunit AcrA (membrane-fusion protein) [Microbacterium invictum]